MNTVENTTCQNKNTTCQSENEQYYEKCAPAEWRVVRYDKIAGRTGRTTVSFKEFAQSITTRNACFTGYNGDIEEFRRMTKEERAEIKKNGVLAYCLQSHNATVTKSAEFKNNDVNDLIVLDFDTDEKGEHLTPEAARLVRDACAKSPACVFAALSLSGAGAFAVMRVYDGFWRDQVGPYIDLQRARMDTLFRLMPKVLGINAVCDKACKDVSRLRAGSYDPDAYYNPQCSRCISTMLLDFGNMHREFQPSFPDQKVPGATQNPTSQAVSPQGTEGQSIEGQKNAQNAPSFDTPISENDPRVVARAKNRVVLCASKAKALEALEKLATLKRNSGAGVHSQVWRVALNLYERCFIWSDFRTDEVENMVIEACKKNGEYHERPNDVLASIRAAKEEAEIKYVAKRVREQIKRDAKKAASSAEMAFLMSYWERLRYDTFADNYLDTVTGKRHNIDYVGAWIARDLEASSGRRVSTAGGIDLVFKNVRQVEERCFDGLYERAQELASEGECGAIDEYCARCGFDQYESKRLRLWLYQACARAFIPGEKTDNILIFASRQQGIGKTWFCDMISQALCGTGAFEYRKEAGKDARIMMSRASVARLDEVDVWTRKTDLATLKSLMTETQSIERAPYAHASEQRLYRAVLVGTTNKEDIIPEGEEMARRYWIVKPRQKMLIDLKTARALVAEACADVLACISHKDYDASNPKCKVWLESESEVEQNTARNARHKDHGSATSAIMVGAKLLRALAYRESMELDDTLCLGSREWAAVLTTGDMTLLGSDKKFVPIKAGVKEVSNIITQRVKRTKDKYRNSGYCLRDIEAAIKDMEQEEVTDVYEATDQTTTATDQDATATEPRTDCDVINFSDVTRPAPSFRPLMTRRGVTFTPVTDDTL